MSDAEGDAYDRGHVAGRIEARLAGHDQHFSKLNGTTSELKGEMSAFAMQLQRIADQLVADAATRVQLADALRLAEEARRASEHDQRAKRAHRFSPTLFIVAVLSVIIAAASWLDRVF